MPLPTWAGPKSLQSLFSGFQKYLYILSDHRETKDSSPMFVPISNPRLSAKSFTSVGRKASAF